MKKVILSVFVVVSLMATSCKKTKEAADEAKNETEKVVDNVDNTTNKVVDDVKTTTDKVVDDAKNTVKKVESAIEGITIPEFSDEKVTAHVKEYSEYAKDYIAKGADVVKDTDLAKKGVELATKGAELVKTMDAETKKKFDAVMNAIKSKMAPAK